MARFKEYVLEEGELLDAIKAGVSAGLKAFQKKWQDKPKKPSGKELADKAMSAEGKELSSVIKQIVDDGYILHNGKIQKPPLRKRMQDWLHECTNIKKALRSAK